MNGRIQWQRAGLVLFDAVAVALALYAGYMLRFEFAVPAADAAQYLLVVPAFVAVRLVLFAVFNLYRGILRYASTTELQAIFFSTAAGSLLLAAANALVIPLIPAVEGAPSHLGHLQRVPWSVVCIESLLTLLLVGAIRFSRRIVVSAIFTPQGGEDETRRVLIIGAGDAGEAVARQMRQAVPRVFVPVAFADDDPRKLGRRIHGIPVAGRTDSLAALIARFRADEVLIAIPGIRPARLREIVAQCEHAKVGFKILPSVQDVFAGRVSVSQIRPVEIEDLLGRDEVQLDLPPERNYVAGKTVLITGAGGSIGSELCRQILRLGPARLVLMGKGENSIYELIAELTPQRGGTALEAVIGDVRDRGKVEAVFAAWRPQLVFHAAAHKHVPLMEAHPDEAVKNNIIGTRIVAEAADASGAEKFILISSDKAVRPTNVMGATKRVAEMIIFCLAERSRTQFAAVRFGNVLGSRGSVIPLFKRQIARGGPVTVTHPDVTRFFMTIPEAVSLVIMAGANPEQRRLYLLDMGQPVRILDLAHNLIRLSGLEPDRDIRIEITGLRPGEKLTEELLTAAEGVRATDVGKLFITEPEAVDCVRLEHAVAELSALAAACDADGIRRVLHALVPDFTNQGC
ncbi:MAG: polysaccharide biosynthesis protein [Candidatus Sumerlaeaceae bacterium]|nr:polysaccharide biosynthesis protein [Candidatus Sumerlaeaceae bacterium]